MFASCWSIVPCLHCSLELLAKISSHTIAKIMHTKNVHSTGMSVCILCVYLVVTDHQAWDGDTKQRYVISPINSNAKAMLA